MTNSNELGTAKAGQSRRRKKNIQDEILKSGIPSIYADNGPLSAPTPTSPAGHSFVEGTDPPASHKTTLPKSLRALMDEVADLLHKRTHRNFALYKPETLLRRLQRHTVMSGAQRLEDYLQVLRYNPDKLDLLARDILISVTSFFRDPEAYDSLATKVVSPLVRRKPLDQTIRIWVAGCSTGEEAYSIAILFREEIERANRHLRLQIFASDIDETMISAGRVGYYPDSIRHNVSEERLERFFTKQEKGYRVIPELRETIVFTTHDLFVDAPFSRLDLVVCRNVFIYLRPQAQETILSRFHFALRENGTLFLGPSETLGNLREFFTPLCDSYRIYRRNRSLWPYAKAFTNSDVTMNAFTERIQSEMATDGVARQAGIRDVTERYLSHAYPPASVTINQKYQVLHFTGAVGQYLKLGAGSIHGNLLSLIQDDLLPNLRAILHRATQLNECQTSTGVRFTHQGVTSVLTLTVQPLTWHGTNLLLVIFIPEHGEPSLSAELTRTLPQAMKPMEREEPLVPTRAQLEATIRRLELLNADLVAANEETMSTIEEHQATNEELETSKEELQSLNEELTTLNNQLHYAIEQQRRTTDDLQNILKSSDIPMLFLDRELSIRFFSPASNALFGVIPSDTGRPIMDLAPRFVDENMLSDAQAVLANGIAIRREVSSGSGSWFIRTISPNRSADNRIEGVVLTLADISDIKAVEHEIRMARTFAENVINTIREPLVVLDANMHVISANQSFFDFFEAHLSDIIGRRITDTSAKCLITASLAELIGQSFAEQSNVEHCRIEANLPSKGDVTLAIALRAIHDDMTAERKVLMIIDNITERERVERELQCARQKSESANLIKSQFLAAASHDLRQPLQTLRLLCTVLSRRLTNEADLHLVSQCGDAVDAMAGIMNAILDINQLEAGVIQPAMQDFAVSALFEHLQKDFAFPVEAKGLSWRCVQSTCIVRSDPRLLNQILRNLLHNAVKFTTKGRVLLGCRRQGKNLRIEVRDSGPGIPESELQVIFQHFHRGSGLDAGFEEGLGLGLAIVRRLSDILNHAVDVDSRVGKGSCFSVVVPLSDDTDREKFGASQFLSSLGAGLAARILAVEDDPSVREVLEILFANEGFITATASSGPEALACVPCFRPDIIIVDYGLPGGMNGLQVVSEVRASLSQSIPAVVLTGDVSLSTRKRIEKEGHVALTKPIKAEELMASLRRLLGQRNFRLAAPESAKPMAAADASTPVTIYVVDDDAGIRKTLQQILGGENRSVETFANGEDFIKACRPDWKGCVLLDVRMPGMDGFEVLARLGVKHCKIPVIMITGQGDTRSAVRALKLGALDFIEKPFDEGELRGCINRAISQAAGAEEYSSWRADAARRVAELTKRQREVLDRVVAGKPNKIIAADLSISQRTVENHRAVVMKRLGVNSFADLVRMALAAK